jgi:signal transduction histidine kinase
MPCAAPYGFFVTPEHGSAQHAARAVGPPWGAPWQGGPYRLAALVAVFQLVGTSFAADEQPERRALDAIAILLLVAGPAALALRRRYPVHVLLFAFGTALTYDLLGYPHGPVFVSPVVATVAAIGGGHRKVAIVTLFVGYVSFVWLDYLVGVDDAPTFGEALAAAAWIVGIIAVAEIGRTRKEAAREAARTRREEEKRRASEERLRMAQDLHDVLAHNISLINVQAGVALHLMDENPEQARTALSAIKEVSDGALGELRSVLEILRRADDDAPRAPSPGVTDVSLLIERSRAAGLEVTTEVAGQPRPLPPAVDQAAFRIVQEALTNVVRHAGRAHAHVRLTYTQDNFVVEVEDDGSGPAPVDPAAGGGNGIPGMKERAQALGGEFRAGARPRGGFSVYARIPLPDKARVRT